jgi:cob(I)alamin adenosyltransferase
MSIVTKRGDKGKTSLFLGGMVAKDNPRVEFEGVLDELCSFIGLAKSLVKNKIIKKTLEELQKDLFIIGAEAATFSAYLSRLSRRIGKNDNECLEMLIEDMESKRKPKERCFILPGENHVSGVLDVCRTIARRAERRAVSLTKKRILKNPYILIYLNRLSDLLYLLARRCEKE